MDKVEYLSLMFNTRTRGKKYENYVVNAIYQRVGNPDLIPVTQQCVHSMSNPDKYYLIDLYFPQINYGIEVDEGQHESLGHKISDKERALEIMSSVECPLGRIPVTENNGTTVVSLERLNSLIDEQVRIIKEKIGQLEEPLVWLTEEEQRKAVSDRGYFDVSDSLMYDNILDIRKMIGQEPTVNRRCWVRLNQEYALWVPFLAMERPDGSMKTLNGWENTLSGDGTVILERLTTGGKEMKAHFNPDIKRVVFMHMKDRYGRNCRKFIGVFQYKGKEGEAHRYERIGTRVKISDLKKNKLCLEQ